MEIPPSLCIINIKITGTEDSIEVEVISIEWVLKRKEDYSFESVTAGSNNYYIVERKHPGEPTIFKVTGKIASALMGKKGSFREDQNWKLTSSYRVICTLLFVIYLRVSNRF